MKRCTWSMEHKDYWQVFAPIIGKMCSCASSETRKERTYDKCWKFLSNSWIRSTSWTCQPCFLGHVLLLLFLFLHLQSMGLTCSFSIANLSFKIPDFFVSWQSAPSLSYFIQDVKPLIKNWTTVKIQRCQHLSSNTSYGEPRQRPRTGPRRKMVPSKTWILVVTGCFSQWNFKTVPRTNQCHLKESL